MPFKEDLLNFLTGQIGGQPSRTAEGTIGTPGNSRNFSLDLLLKTLAPATSDVRLPPEKPEKIEPGPNEKLVQSAIDKRKKAQVEEALNSDSPANVLNRAKQMDLQEQLSQALSGGGGGGQAGEIKEKQQSKEGDFSTLSKLLVALGAGLATAGGGDASAITGLASKRLDSQNEAAKTLQSAIAKEQERTQKMEDSFFENVLTDKPLAGDSAKQFNFANEANTAAVQLKEILTKLGPEEIRTLAFPGNKVGQRVKTLVNKIKAELSPARGGANLSEQELKLINSLIPKRGLAAIGENPEETLFKLDSIIGSTDRLKNLIQPNSQRKLEIQQLLALGFDRKSIFQEFRRRGEV